MIIWSEQKKINFEADVLEKRAKVLLNQKYLQDVFSIFGIFVERTSR